MAKMELLCVVIVVALCSGALGAILANDALCVRREMRRLAGNTREQTLINIRAQVDLLRREYGGKPGDRFAMEILQLCDRLEETMRRLEANEWNVVV